MQDELYHFGVKGMKWGRRKVKTQKDSPKQKRQQKIKEMSKMSDDQLRKAINRLQMEKQYSELVSGRYKTTVDKGKSAVAKYLAGAGMMVTLTGTTGKLIKNVKGLRALSRSK